MSDSNDQRATAALPSGSVEQKVLEIIADEADTDPHNIEREMLLLDLLDSLGVTEAVMALEDEFELSVPDDDASNLRTVGDVVDYVRARVQTPPASGGTEAP